MKTIEEILQDLEEVRAKKVAELEKEGVDEMIIKEYIRDSFHYNENCNPKIWIYSCFLGDNAFCEYMSEDDPDYEKYSQERPLLIDNPNLEYLRNNPLVEIVKCDRCCRCGDW